MALSMEKYPIDFDALKKGDLIPADKLEEIFGVKRDTKEYRFEQMNLVKKICDYTGFTAKSKDEFDIEILLDEAATDHNFKLIKQNVRSIHRRQELNQQVEVANLSDEQKAKHDRHLMVGAFYAGALLAATKQITIEVKRQDRPGLNPPRKRRDF